MKHGMSMSVSHVETNRKSYSKVTAAHLFANDRDGVPLTDD